MSKIVVTLLSISLFLTGCASDSATARDGKGEQTETVTSQPDCDRTGSRLGRCY